MAAIGKNLAGKVFKLQNAGGNVPSNILASSRALLAGNGSPGDLNAVRNFLGIQKSGASAQKRELRTVNNAIGAIQRTTQLIGQISQGGVGGLFAGLELQKQISQAAQKYVASPAFEKLLQSKFGMDPVSAARTKYQTGRLLRIASLVGSYAETAYGIAAGVSEFAAGGGDERRKELEDARLSTLMSNDPLRRAAIKAKADDSRPLVELFSPFRGEMKSAAERGKIQTEADIKESGLSGLSAKNLRSLARQRRLESGGIVGETLDTLSGLVFPTGQAQADTKQASEMLKRSADLTKQAYAALESNNFAAAQEAFNAAAHEVGKPPLWRSAMGELQAVDAARGAARIYAQSQNPTPPLRIGE